MSRRVVSIAALLVMLTAAMPGALAKNAGSTVVFNEPLEFTFPAGMCPDLPEDLSIHFTGTVRGKFHLSEDAQGVFHVSGTQAIYGTAVDSEGATYRFNYHNKFHAQDAGFPIEVKVTDHFNLVGNGGVNHLHTFFVLTAIIDDDGVDITVIHEHGDPDNCDAL